MTLLVDFFSQQKLAPVAVEIRTTAALAVARYRRPQARQTADEVAIKMRENAQALRWLAENDERIDHDLADALNSLAISALANADDLHLAINAQAREVA